MRYLFWLYAKTYVFPPDTYKIVGLAAFVTDLPISMCPMQWLTATKGLFHNKLSIRAQIAHDLKGAPIPS